MGFLPQREYDVAESNMVKKILTGKIHASSHNFENYSTLACENRH